MVWYRQAAEQGVTLAAFRIGRLYQKGSGVSKSSREAASWYEKAARRNSLAAQLSLARLYDDSDDTLYDPARAEYWYQAAEKHGIARRQTFLNDM